MTREPRKSAVTGTCHCGAVSVTLPAAPTSITHCNCGLCRRYGVLWTYCQIAEVTVTGDTDTYAWNGENVAFHRCKGCGCVTHWSPRKSSRTSMGINARLFDPEHVAAAEIVLKDDARSGLFY